MTKVTNALNFSTNIQYDYASGKTTQATDPNGTMTTYSYGANGDVLDRLSEVQSAKGTSIEADTNYIYNANGTQSRIRTRPAIS